MPLKVRRSILAFLLLAISCSSPTGPRLDDGVLATFDVNGERYSIFITNTQTIDQVIALWNGQSNANIPSGRVIKVLEHRNTRIIGAFVPGPKFGHTEGNASPRKRHPDKS
jgi:hypothetical protein